MTLSDEKKINKYLKRSYIKIGVSGRPVMNNNDSTPMYLGLGLIQMDLNERDKLLMTSMWVRMVSNIPGEVLTKTRGCRFPLSHN